MDGSERENSSALKQACGVEMNSCLRGRGTEAAVIMWFAETADREESLVSLSFSYNRADLIKAVASSDELLINGA